MTGKQNTIIIRADAGNGVGAGHLMRMLALANGCRKLGFGVTFAVTDIPGSIAQKIDNAGCKITTLTSDRGSQADALETLELARRLDASWLILDGYCFDDDYQHLAKPESSLLMVVDDFGHGSHDHADLVLNQNAYADVSRYNDLLDTQILCGIRYTLLKPEFQERPASENIKNKIRSKARRILVTMGGCDEKNYTLPIIKSLEEIHTCRKSELHVDCVIGPNFAHEETLREFEQSSPMRFRIHRNVDRMDVLMRETDLAITAGGSTCYELAALGVPAIAIATADNQVPVVKDLSKRNTLCRFKASQVNLGAPASPQPELAKFIKTLIDNPEQRRLMAKGGRALLDGLGAHRVARAL